MDLQKIFYYAGTHWDREWYHTFQGFRVVLVERIDEVIETLESDPTFTLFHFDGQTILLDDYCKIKPENRDRLVRLIGEGRIVVGPWYTMPDELLVSGESLIRNLLMGHALSASYGGKAMEYGFMCDIFGHNAQMPQILNGFHITGALVGRGTNSHNCPANFIWESPDGSRCITFKVPESTGYASFWNDVYYENGSSPEKMLEGAIRYVKKEMDRTTLPLVVLMDGMDHERIHRQAPAIAAGLAKAFGCPVVFESLESYACQAAVYASEMPVKRGELIETAKEITNHHMLIPHTLSSRYDIKEANDRCQTLYEKWLLPLAAMAAAEGSPIPATYWQEGYRHIVKCHAHDSICGCSIDGVHRDMHYRFRQASAIGTRLVDDRLIKTARDTGYESESHNRLLSIFNPLPFSRRETITVSIDFPADYPFRFAEYKRMEPRNAFRLLDAAGREVPYNLLDVLRGSFAREVGERYRAAADMHTISFVADMPAMGYAEYLVVPSATPVRYLDGLSTSGVCCENAFLRLTVNADGTVDILDKQTGKACRNLASYADCGETGDGWHHVAPIAGGTVLSKGAPCTIALVNDGPASCTYMVTHRMLVPRNLDSKPGHTARSGETEELVISTRFTLGSESRYVDVQTTVRNTVEDHRLQLVLPTGIASGEYQADQAFCFVTRPTGFDRGTGSWYERAVLEKPFESVVLKRDCDGNGLAFLSAHGLHECAALDDADGTLLVTLFRSFTKTHLTDGEPDGQLQQDLRFRYRLMPLRLEDGLGELILARDCLQAGQKALTRRVASHCLPQANAGWLEVSGRGVAATIVKPPEDGGKGIAVVRVANYSEAATTAAITTAQPVTEAWEADMLEQPLVRLSSTDQGTPITLGPWQIKTCLLKFGCGKPD